MRRAAAVVAVIVAQTVVGAACDSGGHRSRSACRALDAIRVDPRADPPRPARLRSIAGAAARSDDDGVAMAGRRLGRDVDAATERGLELDASGVPDDIVALAEACDRAG
jgi:hypothetical protein